MKNKLLCILFILLMAAAVFVQFSPADVASIQKENRTITPMPVLSAESLKNGSFMTKFDSYVNDNIGYRTYFTEAADRIKSYSGIKPPEGRVSYTDKDIGTETVKKACILLLDDKIMEVFSSNEKMEKIYIDAVNECTEKIPQEVNVYSLLVPTQLEFQSPIYRNIQTDQKKTIENIYSSLDDRITRVDAYSELQKHMGEYIYFRTDHHWTALGAYYAYEAFAGAANFECAPITDFEKRKQPEPFLGQLGTKAEGESFDDSLDILEWYNIDEKNTLRYTFRTYDESGNASSYKGTMYNHNANDYSFFFKSDHPYVKIRNSSVQNGRTALIIKDSYANAFAPWLTNSFENVVMIDPRSFKGDIAKIIEEDGVTDLVFMHYVFTTSFADYCEMMTNMWK